MVLFKDDAVVQPGGGRPGPDVGAVAMLVSNHADGMQLCRQLALADAPEARLFMSWRRTGGQDAHRHSVVAPFIGAPYAVMLAEVLWSWGVETLYVMGWCGALDARLAAGDILVPDGAWIDEGVCAHYLPDNQQPGRVGSAGYVSAIDGSARPRLQAMLDTAGMAYRCGPIWSTDAIYRETPAQIAHFQNLGALAVEMEMAALFSAARYRGMDMAPVLVVSDTVTTSGWKPGFGAAAFKSGRRRLTALLADLITCSKKGNDTCRNK